jgi:hypothetical protein
MNFSTHSAPIFKGKKSPSLRIRTTLHDLVAAIRDVVDAEEDDLIVACVVHVLTKHRVNCLRTAMSRGMASDAGRTTRPEDHSVAAPRRSGRPALRRSRALPPWSLAASRPRPSISPQPTSATA